MTHIIIFEGADHCGKTTIAQEFVKRNPEYSYFKVKQEQIHVEKLSPDVLKQAHLLQLNFFYELARQVDFNIVMDRFYPSEYVYGGLFRNIDEEKIMEFDKLFAAINTSIVVVEKKDDRLVDKLWSKEQLIAIKDRFIKFAAESKCNVLRLHTDSENLEEQLTHVNDFIGKTYLKEFEQKHENFA